MAVQCSGRESGSGSILPIAGPSLTPHPGSSLEVDKSSEELGRGLGRNGAKCALGGAAQPFALEIRAQAAPLTRVTFPLHSTIFSSNATRSRETLCPTPTLRALGPQTFEQSSPCGKLPSHSRFPPWRGGVLVAAPHLFSQPKFGRGCQVPVRAGRGWPA